MADLTTPQPGRTATANTAAPSAQADPDGALPGVTASALAHPTVSPRLAADTVVAGAVVVAGLYFGREILVPFALALLLGFILDPLVTRLRRWGAPRVLAVVSVMLATVTLLGATTLFVGSQVVQLSQDLPTYQSTIQGKLRALRQYAAGRGVMDDVLRMADVVGGELDAARRELDHGSARRPAPQRVQVEPAPRTAVQTVADLAAPLMGPLGTAGIVLVFVVFILLERHDMRDRLLRLAGGDLRLTTDALGEAGERVSRYLTMQLLVNLSYGVPMALGLWAIGVPGALLWGLVSAMLRFVPYVGPVIAAVFPLTLAFAVDPGWTLLLWTLALVLTLELLSNNVVEPWLYGASTGLSAVSIIVSAVFWTALWGPIGLILATPLTVCLAVLGRHLPRLAWLDVLLGNAPVFDAPTRLSQRLLAGDVDEAAELAQAQVQAQSLLQFADETALPVLQRAAAESQAGRDESARRLLDGLAAVLSDLHDSGPATPPSPSQGDAAAAAPAALLGIALKGPADQLAAQLLAQLLAATGAAPGGPPDAASPAIRVLPASALSLANSPTLEVSGVHTVVLSALAAGPLALPQAALRQAARRLRRRAPGLRIVAALWGAPPTVANAELALALGVDEVVVSLQQALACVQRSRPAPADGPAGAAAAAVPSQAAARPADGPVAGHPGGAPWPSLGAST